jgi:hypothetical protein
MIAQDLNVTNGLLANYDILEPLWSKKLFQPYGAQGLDLLQMFFDMGAKEAVSQITGEHWEEDRFDTAFTISNNPAAPGAGNNVTVTLTSSYVDTSTGGSYPIEGNLVMHLQSEQRYQIITKTVGAAPTYTTQFVLRPLLSTTNVDIAAGDTFIIYSNSVPEGSDAQDSQVSFQTKYQWYLQDIRNDDSISGTALTDSLKPVYREDGLTLRGYSSLLTAQLEYRHLKAIVGAMLYGRHDNNLASTTSLDTTIGMVDAFNGRAQTEDTGGTLTYADFAALEAKLSKVWATQNYVCLLSGRSYGQIQDDVRGDFSNSLMNAVDPQLAQAIFGNGPQAEQLYYNYSIQGLSVNGRSFGTKRVLTFDDVAWAGALDASSLQDYGFVMPAGKTTAKDASGREMFTNYVTMKYKDYGQNRLMRMWPTGGASPARNTAKDESKVHVISEVGFDFTNITHCGLFRKAAVS